MAGNEHLQANCDHNPEEFQDGKCIKPCGVQLLCGDICEGSCSECQDGRLHVPCKQPCNKLLICGHYCEAACKAFCPPCPKSCKTKCAHKNCERICGAPCIPCQEACTQRCEHGECKQLCMDPCDSVGTCMEACQILLACGHNCVGLCGLPCPPCRTCHPDHFLPVFHVDEEDIPTASFVHLQPCEHNIELVSLRKWLAIEVEISPKRCPKCTTIIDNCLSFKEIKLAMKSINEVKVKEFGDLDEIGKMKDILFKNMKNSPFNIDFEEDDNFNNSFNKGTIDALFHNLACILKMSIKNKNDNQNVISKAKLTAISFKFDFLKILNKSFDPYWKKYDSEIKLELEKKCKRAFELLCHNDFVLQQQVADFTNELRRLEYYAKLNFICSSGEYLSNRGKINVKDVFIRLESLIKSPYSSEILTEIEKLFDNLQAEVNLASQITTEERKMVHVAMCASFNQPQGHWFKCSKGHIYCITECGGAEELSVCPDCGEQIGGMSHRYVESIQLASEMDGARYPAWSSMNDMNNYDLNE